MWRPLPLSMATTAKATDAQQHIWLEFSLQAHEEPDAVLTTDTTINQSSAWNCRNILPRTQRRAAVKSVLRTETVMMVARMEGPLLALAISGGMSSAMMYCYTVCMWCVLVSGDQYPRSSISKLGVSKLPDSEHTSGVSRHDLRVGS